MPKFRILLIFGLLLLTVPSAEAGYGQCWESGVVRNAADERACLVNQAVTSWSNRDWVSKLISWESGDVREWQSWLWGWLT